MPTHRDYFGLVLQEGDHVAYVGTGANCAFIADAVVLSHTPQKTRIRITEEPWYGRREKTVDPDKLIVAPLSR